MNWKDNCFAALDAEKMFESSGHRTRFKEMLDCYYSYPFLRKDSANVCICLPGMKSISAYCLKH